MLIKNFQEVINNSNNELTRKARKICLTLIETAILAANPQQLIKNKVLLYENLMSINQRQYDLNDYDRILVIGAGKASGKMAESLENILGRRITDGIVNVPEGTIHKTSSSIIKMNEAGHPIPTLQGQKGAQKILNLLENLDERTLVFTLISGGGSSLLPLPPEEITLEEKKKVNALLIKSGASINEVNVVRKHISKIKGGRLGVTSYPATMISLILSDVLGDPLTTIASGPTVPDPSTYRDAVNILKYYNIWKEAPSSIRKLLNDGLKGKKIESPKNKDYRFSKIQNIILGNNQIALEAAEKKATTMGLNTLRLTSYISGEARHVGTVLSAIARELVLADNPISRPGVILAGGETTVTVIGEGRGGRNEELVLSASLNLEDLASVVIASIGTDGIDGVSDAAGAIIDPTTTIRAQRKGLNTKEYLKKNDSHTFFKQLGDLIFTGYTETNVNDIMIIVGLK